MDSIPDKRPLILDGGTATGLAEYGYDYDGSMEQWLLENEKNAKRFRELQAGFVSAGADVIYTPTLTANPKKLERFGLADKCEEINRSLGKLTRENAPENVYVAGDIGATNCAVIPLGEESFSEIISQYRRQIKALDPYVDFYVVETVTSMSDMRAALLACKKTNKPTIVTVSVDENGETYSDGVPIRAMLIVAQSMGAAAFGVNCTKAENAVSALKDIAPIAKIPLVAKPCNMIYEDEAMYFRTPEEADSYYRVLLDMGVEILGGCCGTTAKHIASLKKLTENYVPRKAETETEDTTFIFVSGKQVFYLTPDTIEITEGVTCSVNMDEDILDECSGSDDVLAVDINTPEDPIDFTKNMPMATLPVMFRSDNEIALKMALMLFQGRAMIDSSSLVDEDALKEMAAKYGALIY